MVKHLTYKDIPRKSRERVAVRESAELKATLNRAISGEQRTQQLGRLETLRKWVSEDLSVVQPEVRKGVDHQVVVSETFSLKEN